MKRLSDRYYELVLERDMLQEELDYLMENYSSSCILECMQLKTIIDSLNEEIQKIENEVNNEPKKYYIITREVYDIENDDFYSFMNEYSSIAEALVEFTIQKNELKELFEEHEEICETEDYFYIRDNLETVEIALHEVFTEQ